MQARSLKDIAKELNLSKTTISWVLSGKGKEKGCSQSTIQRVEEYAASINYRPNLLARSLSMGKTNTIGLIIPFIGDSFYAQMVEAIEKEAFKHNYVLIVCSSEDEGPKEVHLIDFLKAKQVDGIIIVPSERTSIGIRSLLRDNLPLVLIDRYYPTLNAHHIIVNNEQSSFDLTSTLIGQGARKIAILYSSGYLLGMQQRLYGYKRALTEADFEPCDQLCLEINRTKYIEQTAIALEKLLADVPDVDGLFFANHYLAIEAIRYFVDRKINYTQRFKMACFHLTTTLPLLAPGMTVARMPIDEMGKQAVTLLLNHNSEVLQQLVFKTTPLAL